MFGDSTRVFAGLGKQYRVDFDCLGFELLEVFVRFGRTPVNLRLSFC